MSTHRALPASFVPGELVRSGRRIVLVLGTVTCKVGLCAELWSGRLGSSGTVEGFSRLTPPPSTRSRAAGLPGSVDSLVFANPLDGYAVESGPSSLPGTTLYATTDGARSWRLVSFAGDPGAHITATPTEFYALLTSCTKRGGTKGAESCDTNRLARSAAGSTNWSVATIPGISSQDSVDLDAAGDHVYVDSEPENGASTVVLTSTRGRPPFPSEPVRPLLAVTSCGLTVMVGGTWAECPTGMLVSFMHAKRPDGPYSTFWTYAGTGGGGLDPLNGRDAYRYTGVAATEPQHIAAHELQYTSNGGASFTSIGTLPVDPLTSVVQLLFLNTEDGFVIGVAYSPSGNADNTTGVLFETDDGGRTWHQLIS